MYCSFQSALFTITKFEPHNIILQHNLNRKLYRYEEQKRPIKFDIWDELIIKAERLCQGFIYEKELSSLQKQVQPKLRAENRQQFSETELNNTFQPILNYLQQGNSHGSITLGSILIDNEGRLRLKDPRLTTVPQVSNLDFPQLGFVILQCALLKTETQLHQTKKSLEALTWDLKRFSAKFIANVWLLLSNDESMRKQIKLSEEIAVHDQYQKLIQDVDKMKKEAILTNSKIDTSKTCQQKRIIIIPPLNLKFHKVKRTNILKLQFSGKNRGHNQNENEQSLPKKVNYNVDQDKCLNIKLINKNEEQKIKFKKLQVIENFKTPLKRKGKTSEKRIK